MQRYLGSVKMSSKNANPTSAPLNEDKKEQMEMSLTFQKARENRILIELNSTMQTLSDINDVLDDLIDLTTPSNSTENKSGIDNMGRSKSSRNYSSVAVKQDLLCKELRNWNEVGPPKDTEI